ncbi:CRISPR-associated endonuclease Cas2 [Clostridium sp. D2Q-14]|uniref:CRISPR-associated endonuclease Cas2 n=1 Tax=Anaeromonas gelatinilytica TaxID=2683194 RepID=UPI00193C58C9|nr:CRISPR-associated endonuclease Cas2 [Anaeromonas gelatinilytica]MBS4534392.1 CRISPR-associated endonuclease Cas2 [Anaeromonas gelatinilytica]
MYIILMYDILADENGSRISRNVFKICKKYLTHIQKSVFEGNLTEINYMKLKSELDTYIRKDKDSLLVFKSRHERWLEKDYLGVVDDKTSNFF